MQKKISETWPLPQTPLCRQKTTAGVASGNLKRVGESDSADIEDVEA